jgi:hypothetical protein
VKLQAASLQFAPRRLSAGPSFDLQQNPETRKHEQLQQLRAEHPGLSRGVGALQVAAWVAADQVQQSPWTQVGGGLSGIAATSSALWGLNKLVQGESALDRIEGVGHLAIATAYSADSLRLMGGQSAWLAAAATPCNYLAAGCEMFLGAADLYRGLKEEDRPRTWVGVAGLVSGAAYAASVAIPAFGGLGQAAVILSLAARQAILGGEV